MAMLTLPFASQMNFLDPKLTSDGQPYGPTRFKEIVKECFIISKNCATSYTDLMNITPVEKNYMLEFIAEEMKNAEQTIKRNREQLSRGD